MLGSDYFKIEGIQTVYGSELKSLVLLYNELVSNDVIMTFMSLIYQAKEDFKPLNELLMNLNISVDIFETRLHQLEKLGLVKTYIKDKQYIFVLQKPLSYHDFINHDILCRVLLTKVNREYYEFLKRENISYISDKSEYTDISSSFNFAELNTWTKQLERDFTSLKSSKQAVNKTTFDCHFDIKGFVDSLSSTSFPPSERSYDNLNEMGRLIDMYSPSPKDIKLAIYHSIDLSRKPIFDLNKFGYLIAKGKPHEEFEGYDAPPNYFLSKLQGQKLNEIDAKLIYKLTNNFDLKREVINYLLEHHLKTYHNQLIPNVLLSYASNMVRNNIDNIDKAKAFLSQNVASKAYVRDKKDILPDYSGLEKSLEDFDAESALELLNEKRKKLNV